MLHRVPPVPMATWCDVLGMESPAGQILWPGSAWKCMHRGLPSLLGMIKNIASSDRIYREYMELQWVKTGGVVPTSWCSS